MNIVLIGYRGTGKTTVARLLAQRLQLSARDADDELQRIAGKTIAEIFGDGGEEAFRELESQILIQLCRLEGLVLSAGGGAVLCEKNRRRLRDWGTVIWLEADASTIHQRMQTDPTTAASRPALTRQGGLAEIEHLLEQRRPLYETTAHLRVDTSGKTPSQVCEEIVSLLQPPAV